MVPAGVGACWGAVGVGWVPTMDKPRTVARTRSLFGAGAWWDGDCEASGTMPGAAVLGGGQSAVGGTETREMLGVPHGMVAGLSVGIRRAGGTCLVVAASRLVGTGVVAEARVDSAGSGLVAPGGCRLMMDGVGHRLKVSCGTAGDRVVMEVLGSTVDDGVTMEAFSSTVGDGVLMEVSGSTAGDGVLMEVSGSTVGDGVLMEALGSTVGDSVLMEAFSRTVGDGVVMEAFSSTADNGVVMEAFGSMVGDGVVMEVLGSTVGDGVVMKAFSSTADDGEVVKALDGMVGDGAVKKASVGMVGNVAEVATGDSMVGSAMMGKAANDSMVGAAVGKAPGDSKVDIPCDDVEVNGRDEVKAAERGRVAGQIKWSSLNDVTACPARWGGLLHDTWVDNLTFSLLPRIQLCR